MHDHGALCSDNKKTWNEGDATHKNEDNVGSLDHDERVLERVVEGGGSG